VLLGCPQQPDARPVPRALVLERDLTEPREGVPHVRRVVNWQATPTTRIDIGEGTIRKLRTLSRPKRRHTGMIARPTPGQDVSCKTSGRGFDSSAPVRMVEPKAARHDSARFAAHGTFLAQTSDRWRPAASEPSTW
jgi:hypothetical protein